MTKRLTLLLALLIALSANAAEPVVPTGLLPLDGRPAPALKLADMDGNVTDLEKLRGSWVLVHFWASWCGPCKKEMPTLQRMSAQVPATDLRVLLINTAETDDEVFTFLPAVAPDMTTLLDRDGKATERWQPRGLPSSFLVDPQGRLRYLALGGRVWDAAGYVAFLRSLSARR
jgi:cytochrome c biogenesis protein CcmG/thiol:disulfide interchange protein DsbE